MAKQEIELIVDDSVIDWVVEHGADAQFGARPLKRFIQRHVETAVAQWLLSSEAKPNSVLNLTIENDEIVIKK